MKLRTLVTVILALTLLSPTLVAAQSRGWAWGDMTISQLPTVCHEGKTYGVMDGADELDCSVGAGADEVTCSCVQGDPAIYAAVLTDVNYSGGPITAVGSMTSGAVFADATASLEWLGLGASVCRLTFADEVVDEAYFQGCEVGIGTAAPNHWLDIFTDDASTAPLLGLEQDGTGDAGLTMGAGLHYFTLGVDNDDGDKFKINNYSDLTQAANERFTIDSTGTELVINNAGSDFDFRVEGDTETELICVDAGNDRVGIGTCTPAVELDVAGSVNISGSLTGAGIIGAGALGSGAVSSLSEFGDFCGPYEFIQRNAADTAWECVEIIPTQASPPGTPSFADLYADTDTNELCFYNGSSWVGISEGGACAAAVGGDTLVDGQGDSLLDGNGDTLVDGAA